MSKIKADKIKLNLANLEDDGVGNLQQVPGTDGTGPSNSEVDHVEYFILSPADISNKYVTLPSEPTDPDKTRVYVISGTAQQKGVDFDIIADSPNPELTRLTWAAPLALDGVLLAGDVLLVVYNVITNISGDPYAASIQTNTASFDGILSASEVNVQTALNVLDNHSHSSADIDTNTTYTGLLSSLSNPDSVENALSVLDGVSATNLPVSTGTFVNNLVTTDDTVLKGLQRLDKMASNEIRVVQAGHGFSVLDAIKLVGVVWAKTKADTFSGAERVFVVKEVISANEFIATSGGRVRTSTPHGFTVGSVRYLSTATAGASQGTKPEGTVNMPLGFHRPLFLVESSTTVNVLNLPQPVIDSVIASGHNASGNLLEFINFDINNYDNRFIIEVVASACIGAVKLRLNGTPYNWRGTQIRPDSASDGDPVKLFHHNPVDLDFSIAQGTGLAGVYFWDTFAKIDISILNQRALVNSQALVGYNASPAESRTNLISVPNITTITSLRVSYEQNAGGGVITARILRG